MPNAKFYRDNFSSHISKEDLESLGVEGDICEDGFDLEFSPADYTNEDFVIKVEDNKISFSYLASDPDPTEYEWGEDVIFKQFRSQQEKDEEMEHLKSEGYDVLSVEEYRHSGSVFALENEGNFPDRQWDVMPNSLLALPKGEFPNPENTARSMLETYNDYCAGRVYGICDMTFSLSSAETLEQEECWGFIGDEHAMSELLSSYGSPEDRKNTLMEGLKRAGFDGDGRLQGHYSNLKPGDGIVEIQNFVDTYIDKDIKVTQEDIEKAMGKKPSNTPKNRP